MDTSKKSKTLSLLDKYHEQIKLIEDKTGLSGNFVVIALMGAIFFVCIGFFEKIITNLVGTVYAVFWTMKSIETNGDDDKHWLTYWVVFAFFTTLEMFSGFILRYIPLYFIFKIIFLIWLQMPNSKGCDIIYHLFVVKVYNKFEKNIDKASEKFEELTKDILNKGGEIVESGKSKIINEVVSKATNSVIESLETPSRGTTTTPIKEKDAIYKTPKKDTLKKKQQ